jgi:signal transduction histidine kinase
MRIDILAEGNCRHLPDECNAEVELTQACGTLRSVGLFTSGIIHDFNVVLQTIQNGYAILALGNPGPAQLQALDQGKRAVQRAQLLLHRLAVLTGRKALPLQPQNLRDLLAGLPEVLRPVVPQSISCNITCEHGLQVRIHPLELEAVLVNLATNSRDAMPDGGALVIGCRKSTETESVDAGLGPFPHALISVRDTGVGMSPETLARAEEPYFTTKGPGEGTGLGLALARDFALSAGGRLRIASIPTIGTTVELFLPCLEEEETRVSPKAVPSHSRGD